ncbi:DJ-1/PfpI family protein [Candidatus Pantoea formicae]|uniref:DJ-1/PfpI family protein n=1 Tax=Candidatus Pantoea formicae TaxID=2608355 RepID=UPI003ED984C5
MKDEPKKELTSETQNITGHSRRDILKLGGFATLGALFGSTYSVPVYASTKISSNNKSYDEPLDIVFAVYNGGTLLDFAGPSEIFHRLPNTTVRYASLHGGTVNLEFGVEYGNTERLTDIMKTDLIMVPGGSDLREAMSQEYLSQIRRLATGARHITSVCNGSLALAAAGVLKGKRSACHWAFVNKLAEYGAIPVEERFVEDDDGRFMSGGGVTAGIDFALRVAEKLKGTSNAELTQLVIEYDPAPPFNSGNPRSAPPEVLAMINKKLPGATQGLARVPGVK